MRRAMVVWVACVGCGGPFNRGEISTGAVQTSVDQLFRLHAAMAASDGGSGFDDTGCVVGGSVHAQRIHGTLDGDPDDVEDTLQLGPDCAR